MANQEGDREAATGRRFPGKRVSLSLLVIAIVLLFAWLGRMRPVEVVPRTLSIYSYSVLDDVMTRGLQPAFQEIWAAETGESIHFISMFAGSGTITDEIIRRFPAEIAILSSEIDAFRLADRGVVPGPSWKTAPEGGVLGRSPLVFVVREGNPKGIASFRDVARDDVGVVLADPATSGVAEWGILGMYGAVFLDGADRDAAAAALGAMKRNVIAPAPSAREASGMFAAGEGDVLLTYEGEATRLLAESGSSLDIVYPETTILVEPVFVLIRRNVTEAQRELVNRFADYLASDAAQEIFAAHGFRSVREDVNRRAATFPPSPKTFTLAELGGSVEAKRRILDAVWRAAP